MHEVDDNLFYLECSPNRYKEIYLFWEETLFKNSFPKHTLDWVEIKKISPDLICGSKNSH